MKTQSNKAFPVILASAALGLNLSGIHQAKADGFVSVRSMNKGRAYHTATLLPNGKVLVAGTAVAGPDTTTSAELYDPATDTWTMTGSMRSPIGYTAHTATLLLNGKVLIAGGNGLVSTAELYDPATGTWTLTGSLMSSRRFHTATLLPDGKVLVAGGYSSRTNTWHLSAELYDPPNGTWTAAGSPGISDLATLLPNGKVLVGDKLYDPATGTWTVTGAPSGRHATRTLLLNGKVLATWGTAELYDRDSGTWSATGSLTSDRRSATATLLRNGQVLVLGGFSNAGATYPTSAELYDPATGTWTETPMSGGRAAHTATLLPNGQVLVAGGRDSRNVNFSTAELYEPDSVVPATSITILHNANHIMSFSWSGVGTLEQSDSLAAPNWQTAPIQDNPLTIGIAGPMKFFRLRFNQ